MRIGIDAHMVGHGETGNESYIAQLLLAIEKSGLTEAFAYLREPSNWPDPVPPQHVRVRRLRPAGDAGRLLFGLPWMAHTDHLDLLHVTYHAPLWLSSPFVVTVHDLSFKHFPRFFSARDHTVFRLLIPATLSRAELVIADSECTRRDLLEFFPQTRGKVTVIPLAASGDFHPVRDKRQIADFCRRYAVEPPFFLALGSMNPRKNLRRLIQAWDLAQSSCPSATLVIAGPPGFRHANLLRAAQSTRAPERIRFIGRIQSCDLPLAYNAAAGLVYPSLYEGFGLPVLEAMACGTPVLASATSSIPEVAGSAALLFDPTSIPAIAESMIRVFSDTDFSQDLRARGIQRASEFSWEWTTQLTWKAYAEARHRALRTDKTLDIVRE
jgi:glycosyltransferase involved in cell wall biosynthesis